MSSTTAQYTARCTRDEHCLPANINIEVTAELGRSVSAHGEGLTRYTNLVYPASLGPFAVESFSPSGAPLVVASGQRLKCPGSH